MIHFKKIVLILILFIFNACSSIPKNTQNSCAIFEERYLWYKHTKASYERWGAPIHLQLAFVKKESDFNWLAKPPRKKLFKVIPFKRPSSSFGYSQAVKGTWEQYKRETNSPLATRARFKDSVDFIGWYIHKTNKILKISKKDPYKQYLAYYKGWGDYKNYSKDKKAIIYAKSVKDMANKYRKQLTLCKKNLEVAVFEAAAIRLRPILMTSLSTIIGVLPLILGTGPGAASRLTVGITIFGGMLFSTFFTLYVIPTIYTIVGKNTKRIDAVEIDLKKQLKK